MIAALPYDVLRERWPPWKVGLYVLEVTPPWGCSFQMSGLAYDIFGKKASKQVPTKKLWDHAIDTKERFMPRKGKVVMINNSRMQYGLGLRE